MRGRLGTKSEEVLSCVIITVRVQLSFFKFHEKFSLFLAWTYFMFILIPEGIFEAERIHDYMTPQGVLPVLEVRGTVDSGCH